MNGVQQMIESGVQGLLIASVSGAFLTLVVWFSHRQFPKVVTPQVAYVLWALVVFRLVLPICPESSFSFMNLLPDMRASAAELDSRTWLGSRVILRGHYFVGPPKEMNLAYVPFCVPSPMQIRCCTISHWQR